MSKYDPAEQPWQLLELTLAYCPDGHPAQLVAPAVAVLNPPQLKQLSEVVAPAVEEYFPAPQFVQFTKDTPPNVAEYRPATHWMHVVELDAPVSGE
jgi:hypothetical protein